MTRTWTVFVASLGLAACSTDDETASATEETSDTVATVTGDGPDSEGGPSPTSGGSITESGGSTVGDSSATTDDEVTPTGSSSGDDSTGSTSRGASSTTSDEGTSGDGTTEDATAGESTDSTTGDETATGDSTTGDDSGGDESPISDPPDLACFWQEALPQPKVHGWAGSLAVADLDADGRRDVIVRSQETSTQPTNYGVNTLRNLGDGRYGPADLRVTGAQFDSQYGAWSIATADFDGDGDVDVAVTEAENDNIHVFPNDGSGELAAASVYPGFFNPETLLAGDLDGDTWPDLVILQYDGEVGVLRNLGDGTFTQASQFDSGVALDVNRPAALADLDDDGHLDLALSSLNQDRLYLFFGLGDGGFAEPEILTTGDRPSGLTIADFDDDGMLDIAVARRMPTATMEVFWNLGGRMFDSSDVFTIAWANPDIMMITNADMDADGRVDLVMATAGRVNVARNLGGGQFADQELWTTGATAGAIAVDDVDGDGRLDILTSNRINLSVGVLRQNPDGSFGAEPPRLETGTRGSIVLEELSGDAHLDVAVIIPGGVRILRGDGDGGYELHADIAVAPLGRLFEAHDLDADGDHDLVVSGEDKVHVLVNQGDGEFVVKSHGGGATGAQFVPADFDGDGKLDLALRGGRSVRIFPGLGNGELGPAQVLMEHPNTSTFNLEAADLDGDGDLDLAFAERRDNDDRVTLLFNEGGGQFTPTLFYQGEDWGNVLARDFDGDGKVDLAVGDGDVIHLFHGQGGGQFVAAGEHWTGIPSSRDLHLADFDGDGVLDMLATSVSAPSLGVLLGTGDGDFAPVQTYITHIGAYHEKFALTDLDADGALDMVFVGSGISTLFNQGDGTFGQATVYTAMQASEIAARDMDGDGRAEVAFVAQDATFMVPGACR